MWTKDQDERIRLQSGENCSDEDLQKIWTVDEMTRGENIIFAATGISDSPMLRGIRLSDHHFITHSLLVGTRSRTMRLVETYHDVHRNRIIAEPVHCHAVPR